jgi:hypothetical protein
MARGRAESAVVAMLLVCVLLASISGCATGSAVVTGEARTPIDPSQVKIYLDPPSEYETIGLVEASSDVEFSSQAAQDRAIDELRKQAAKIGANGVLLLSASTASSGSVGYSSGGVFYADDTEKKVVRGRAILVAGDVRKAMEPKRSDLAEPPTDGAPRTSLEGLSETSGLDGTPTGPRTGLESPSETPGR